MSNLEVGEGSELGEVLEVPSLDPVPGLGVPHAAASAAAAAVSGLAAGGPLWPLASLATRHRPVWPEGTGH